MNGEEDRNNKGEGQSDARKIGIFGRQVSLPRSRSLRIAIGALLVVFGLFGFLPVLGFWMIPLGLLVLSYEFAMIRRMRRKLIIANGRRAKKGSSSN